MLCNRKKASAQRELRSDAAAVTEVHSGQHHLGRCARAVLPSPTAPRAAALRPTTLGRFSGATEESRFHTNGGSPTSGLKALPLTPLSAGRNRLHSRPDPAAVHILRRYSDRALPQAFLFASAGPGHTYVRTSGSQHAAVCHVEVWGP